VIGMIRVYMFVMIYYKIFIIFQVLLRTNKVCLIIFMYYLWIKKVIKRITKVKLQQSYYICACYNIVLYFIFKLFHIINVKKKKMFDALAKN